ncbi:MAG: hypothetical protein H0V09_11645 [Gemmatimonadetes bacterium]|nr:hypothetical protein [Gemmatimonadota bacterium]
MTTVAVAPGATVSIQGEPGSFSESAARRLVDSPSLASFGSFDEAAGAVASGAVRYGVLPVVNSLAGEVLALPEILDRHGLATVAEVSLTIRQCLIAPAPAELGQIVEVRSHPIALRQCRRFFAAHPWMNPKRAADTAGAVKEICASRPRGVAAIAGAAAAERYGGVILAEGIADSPNNVTTFVLLERARTSDR